MGKELERGNFHDSLLRMVFHFECLSKKSVDEGFRMPKRGQHEEISHVENLYCSVVKLVTSPHRPTTSRPKSCTSFSSLSILCDIVRGCGAGGGGGGACAGAGAGTRISRATSLAAGPALSASWAPTAAACCLSGP
ncbi:hypothetical protein Tco_0853294 [Tanacetum coccineum]